jgi:predicted aminopeptidase
MNRRRAAAIAVLAVCLSSCGSEDLGYLFRAAYEEARLLARRQPIDEILAVGEVDEATRGKLELSLAARSFADERLGLDTGGSYRSVAAVDQDQIVHVVSAAYRDRLEAYTWWFPIVGEVPYRGYFRRESALALADELEAGGYDTYVRRALAFSTLGYFDDPLLSHMLDDSDEDLVETILHELLHGTVYFAGQASFNESFANFVGHRGAIAFFEERQVPDAARRARDRWHDARQFGDFLTDVLGRLATAYADGAGEEERRRLFAEARRDYLERSWRTGEYDGFANGPINNAVLLSRRVYFDRLRLFDEVLTRFGGDLPRAVAWIIAAARSDESAYRGVEKALRGRPGGDAMAAR